MNTALIDQAHSHTALTILVCLLTGLYETFVYSQTSTEVLTLEFESLLSGRREQFTLKPIRRGDGTQAVDISVLHISDELFSLSFQLSRPTDVACLFDGIERCLQTLPKPEHPDIRICFSLVRSNGLEQRISIRTNATTFQSRIDDLSGDLLRGILRGKGAQTSSFNYLIFSPEQTSRLKNSPIDDDQPNDSDIGRSPGSRKNHE